MGNMYRPDSWVIIALTTPTDHIKKVLAGWSGGYLYGDEWRLSSGITKVTDKDTHWEIENESGSVYQCHKESERLSGMTGSIYYSYQQQAEKLEGVTIEIIPVEEAMNG
jgi:hypothetical protein